MNVTAVAVSHVPRSWRPLGSRFIPRHHACQALLPVESHGLAASSRRITGNASWMKGKLVRGANAFRLPRGRNMPLFRVDTASDVDRRNIPPPWSWPAATLLSLRFGGGGCLHAARAHTTHHLPLLRHHLPLPPFCLSRHGFFRFSGRKRPGLTSKFYEFVSCCIYGAPPDYS